MAASFHFVRALPVFYRTCGALLLVAATAKSYSPNTLELLSNTATGHAFVSVALAYLEIVVGGLLISHMKANIVRWIAVTMFAAFAVYSTYSLWRGDQTCGCLAEFSPPVGWMLAVDIAAIAGLLTYRPIVTEMATSQYAVFALSTLIAATASFGMQVLAERKTGDLKELRQHFSRTQRIDATVNERKVGTVLQFHEANVGELLSTDHWAILVHSSSCNVCRTMIDRLKSQPGSLGIPDGCRVALASLPVGARAATESLDANHSIEISATLSPSVHWLVTPPVLLLTNGGRITEVRTPSIQ